jgi:hypothetical protein
MKLLLAIPSYNRPYEIEKRTGFWLKKLQYSHWKVFVEPDQAVYYAQTIPKAHLVVTGNNIGLVGQLRMIARYAIRKGYDLVWKIDDDMMFKRKGIKKHQIHEVVEQTIPDLTERFSQDADLGVINIAMPRDYMYKQVYNDSPKFYTKKKWMVKCSYVVRPEDMDYTDGNYTFDDVEIGLIDMEKRKKIEFYAGCYNDNLIRENQGGLQSFDRDEKARQSLAALVKRFPKIKEAWFDRLGVDIDISAYYTDS